ncbi:MAG: hypothetical protein R2745_14415 [Vicinamibacterales bacterium]
MPRAFAFAALLSAVASPLFGQTPSTGTVFAGAQAFASIEKVGATAGFGVPWPDQGGTVAGGGLGLGIQLTPSISARLEWSATDTLKSSSTVGPLPLVTSPLVAMPNGFPHSGTLPFVVDQQYERRRTSTTALALLGYRLGGERLGLELLGGLGVVYLDQRESYDVRILGASLVPSTDYRTAAYRAVAAVGADVPVALTRHASLVPSVRAWAVDGGLTLRPGVGVRWTF